MIHYNRLSMTMPRTKLKEIPRNERQNVRKISPKGVDRLFIYSSIFFDFYRMDALVEVLEHLRLVA